MLFLILVISKKLHLVFHNLVRDINQWALEGLNSKMIHKVQVKMSLNLISSFKLSLTKKLKQLRDRQVGNRGPTLKIKYHRGELEGKVWYKRGLSIRVS